MASKIESKQLKTTIAKPTSITVFCTKVCLQSIVEEFLQHRLGRLGKELKACEYETSEDRCKLTVTFPSVKKAKKACNILQKCKSDFVVSMSSHSLSAHQEIESEIKSFHRSITTKRDAFLAKHDEKIDNLKACLAKLTTTKNLTLDQFEAASSEKKVMNAKVEECQQQRKEFLDYCGSLLKNLSHILSSMSTTQKPLQDTIRRLRVNFGRECNRLLAALPIYARRTDIVQTITSHQVTVLVGETGSGKSTQVVQYLYDAGVARNGLIVCTQPRKVAAITLAEHVSKEMQVKLGAELGYRMGMSKKCASSTKVLFMTDHALLNECISDPSFSKYSCIVIDEAHERSINTDMLLAFVKQCLPLCPELKVVIMSATIEPELFVNYFKKGTTSICTVMVSGRTYPVEVVYDPLMTSKEGLDVNNYVTNAIEMAKRVHSTEPQGDILVFLTSPPEIEKACQALADVSSDAVVLPLYGKLPPKEQQNVFCMYEGKRKIVFSTNIAETSVTIPGVKYIVDTGLAKEMQFDPMKNMDSLEVRLISKSSAEQRKGRAGRTSAGKCFRLYTMHAYNSRMPERMKPEILRIQLSQVVLKLLEFGVSNVLTFDFVEQPDRDALYCAVRTLQFVGAIKDGVLTDLGKKMALLPLNPQLAKVLLDGVEAGVGAEALASVALSSLSGQIFFRGGTDEMKLASDKMKLPFCHKMGDQMTSLLVFQSWLTQQKDKRSQWCVENYVNAKSMRIVEETMKELNHVLRQQLHITVSLKIDSLEAAECYIPKIYFHSFLKNLAVYLGHDRVGYLTLAETSGTFLIFPGSSLKQLNSTPKYVLYEKTLKTSQQFLTQVMDVKQEWVEEAVKLGHLPKDPAETYKAHMVFPLHVVALGPYTYSITKRNAKEITDNIDICCSQSLVSPVLDLSRAPKQWGIVRVFAPQSQHNMVELAILQYISRFKEGLEEANKEFGITQPTDDVRIVIGMGGTIQHVIMPDQFRTVVAKSSQFGEWVEAVINLMKQIGNVVKQEQRQFKKDYCLFVTFQSPTDAQKAVSECEYPGVKIQPHHSNQQSLVFTLNVEWERRERMNCAFINFDSPEDKAIAAPLLVGPMYVIGSKMQIKPDKCKQNSLFVVGDVVQRLSKSDLERQINDKINGIVPFKVDLGYRKCQTTDEQYQAYLRELTYTVGKYTDTTRCKISLLRPQPHHLVFRAFVNFNNPEERQKVYYSELKTERIGMKSLHVSAKLQSNLHFRIPIFQLIKGNIEECRTKLIQQYGESVRIEIKSPRKGNRDVIIELSADDMEVFAVAQNVLHSVAQPDTFECKTPILRQYILSSACHQHLKTIQANTSTYMYTDLLAMNIKIYGAKENRTNAKLELQHRVDALSDGNTKLTEIEVGGTQQPPGLMKHLVIMFGNELEKMLEIEGVKGVTLNPRRQLISLLASKEGELAVRRYIEEYASQPHVSVRPSDFQVECCVCLTQIECPEELFRLEYCGHAYHTECVLMQVNPNTVTLPVQCARDECLKQFVWRDFENIQRISDFKIESLVTASLRDYLEKNGDVARNCPTPDCRMVYLTTENGKPFLCSHCGVRTCTKCHAPYHDGIDCKLYKAMKQGEEEFLGWMQDDPANRKMCPKCKAAIEKTYGCNHMTCRCGAHLCWLCLQCFNTGNECYDHLPYCPMQPK